MKTAVHLFAGIGSGSLAAKRTGHRVVAVERDATACQTLRLNNVAETVLEADVKALDFSRWYLPEGVDLLLGGPPCQPFSQSTDGTGQYDARDCIPDFVRSVRDLRPKLFIMEEVKTLTWSKHAAYLDRVLADLKALNYRVDYRVLDCSLHGVAQKRLRLFIIGTRTDIWPAARVAWPQSDAEPQAMADALGWTAETCRERNLLAPEPAHDAALSLWPLTRPSTTVVGSFRPEVQAAPGYRTAGMGPRQNAAGSVVITEAEALILQGLPADWKIAGNESQRRLQIGNSCPTPTLERLIRANQKEV